ncbi:MAG: DUF86 domain-containing protein [Phycisphaerales bacterium]
MPRRDARMYLADIRVAADRIADRTRGRTFEQFAADEDLRLIVERSFEIIGEALRHAIVADPSLETAISESKRIIRFRNVLIHAYDLVDHTIVWDVIRVDLPTLRAEVEALLAQLGGA